ncbi:MAG: hypothetical protein PHT51_02820 [Patescibacteria group bacterium]|nr:hypothetical protein [Patescibacteria group bacterium]MDD4610818.1 hypothetical protein [Patescibacteria group bacterium]
MRKQIITIITTELFYILTGALVIFCAMELLWERMVLSYVNINWVLIFWLIDVMVLLVINNANPRINANSSNSNDANNLQ